MRPPRRIFRGHSASRPHRWTATVLVGGLALAGAGALLLVSLSSSLFGRSPPDSERLSANPGMIAVIDGETLRLDGLVIRLGGVEAPTRGDLCRGGADCGGAATSALAALVRDRRVECRLAGRDRLGRRFATCDANGTDLSRAIVANGWARAQPGVPELADLELRARRQGTGLWAVR